jgi:hypothetical protein
MALGAYLRSPAALVWTVLGAVAVGAVLAVGWLVVEAMRESAVVADPRFLGGLGDLLYLLVLLVFLAALVVVWLPFEAGIAHAVGRRVRGDRVSLRESARAVRVCGRALARWLKTRVAVGPVAERVITEDDVAPNEVAVGCEKFVVPALLLDAPGMLPRAVERANRVPPLPAHERLIAGALGATGVLAATVVFVEFGAPDSLAAVATPLAAAVVVLGGVVTAALSAAWRARVYVSQDLSEGFAR